MQIPTNRRRGHRDALRFVDGGFPVRRCCFESLVIVVCITVVVIVVGVC